MITAETQRGKPYVLSSYPEMLLDDETAIVTRSDFEKLPAYNTTLPTGKYPGKVWKRGVVVDARGRYTREPTPDDQWMLGAIEADPDGEEGYVLIRWRKLLIA